MTRRSQRGKRPPEGMVRPWKVRQAKKDMFRLVDDRVAIAATADVLSDELYPDNGPPRERRLRLAS